MLLRSVDIFNQKMENDRHSDLEHEEDEDHHHG